MALTLDRVLVDTNLWVLFLKEQSPLLGELIGNERVMTHSCVIGELLIGSIGHREVMSNFMKNLPRVEEVEPAEALAFLEKRRFWGKGLQWNDMLILASAVTNNVKLWTLDKSLAQAAEELGVRWDAK